MASDAHAQSRAATKKLTHQSVLVEWDQFALKNLLNLRELMPTLVEMKVVPARAAPALEKNPTKFLGFLKSRSVEQFTLFCEALAKSFSMNEKHVRLAFLMSSSLERLNVPQGSTIHGRIQAVIETARYMHLSLVTGDTAQLTAAPPTEYTCTALSETVTPTSLDTDTLQAVTPTSPATDTLQAATPTSPDTDTLQAATPTSQATATLQAATPTSPATDTLQAATPTSPDTQATSTHLQGVSAEASSIRLDTKASREASQVPRSLPSHPKAPEGCVPPQRSQHFRREEGGTFYCPAHGVTISIPPLASPDDVLEFDIFMRAYVEGPFLIPDDIEVCMPVLWLGLSPPFTFEKPVRLKVPHSAIVDDENDFVLLRASDDPSSDTYDFTEELEADFSDGYHVVVNLNHFCAVTGGRTKNGSSRQQKKPRRRGGVYKKTRQSSVTRRQGTSTPELVKQTTPELVRRQTSSISSRLSSLSFGNSFESSASPIPMDYSDPPVRTYSDSHCQSLSQSGEDMDGPYHQTAGHRQAATQDPSPYTRSHSQPSESSPPQAQQTATSQSHSPGRQGSSGLRRQEAFDEGSGQRLLTMQQSSGEGNSSCNFMCMAQCTVRDNRVWRVTFLAACSHPTGMLAIHNACMKMQSEMQALQYFRPTGPLLVFHPASWDDAGWTAQTRNSWIVVENITSINCLTEEQTRELVELERYPPRVTYTVDGVSASGSMERKILIRGTGGEEGELAFCLSLRNTDHSRKLQTWSELYSESSSLVEALSCNGHTPALRLDPQEPDHVKLLADLSFQLTRSDIERLPDLLSIDRPQQDRITAESPSNLAEQAFQFLLTWASSEFDSCNKLLLILQEIGITGVEVVTQGKKRCTIDPRVARRLVPVNSEGISVVTVSEKLGPIWKFLGRYLGVSLTTLDNIEHVPAPSYRDHPYEMLHEWTREKGNAATAGALFRAIHRVFEHDPRTISGAHSLVARHIHNLNQELM